MTTSNKELRNKNYFQWGVATTILGAVMFLIGVFAWSPIAGLLLFSLGVMGAGAFLMLEGY